MPQTVLPDIHGKQKVSQKVFLREFLGVAENLDHLARRARVERPRAL